MNSAPLMLALFVLASTEAPPQDWSNSPDAYFLTVEEQRQWKALQSDAERAAFEQAYWRRRDPTPATERNEFREMVVARIRSADAQLSLGRTPGSRTARGHVLIVFGRPSVQRQTTGPLKNAPEMITPGRISIPSDAFNTTEFHTWGYDRDTQAGLLDVLGVPPFEISFIVEPGHRDELQNPGRVRHWMEIVARHSIVSRAP